MRFPVRLHRVSRDLFFTCIFVNVLSFPEGVHVTSGIKILSHVQMYASGGSGMKMT